MWNLFQLIHWFETTSTRHFDDFNGAMTNYYGTDFSCMRAEFLEEQRKWPRSNRKVYDATNVQYCSQVLFADRHVCQSGVRSLEMAWKYLHLKSLKQVDFFFDIDSRWYKYAFSHPDSPNRRPKQLAGSGSPVMEIDLLKITLEDLKER